MRVGWTGRRFAPGPALPAKRLTAARVRGPGGEGRAGSRPLPTASTCGLKLRVPRYAGAEDMRGALAFAAENCQGFQSA